jgi:hypothetical protein
MAVHGGMGYRWKVQKIVVALLSNSPDKWNQHSHDSSRCKCFWHGLLNEEIGLLFYFKNNWNLQHVHSLPPAQHEAAAMSIHQAG